MKVFQNGIRDVLDNGRMRKDRTGVGRLGVFGRMNRYDLNAGFALVTSKFTSFHNIKHELLWMLSGDTTLKYLKENRVSIWDEWVKPHTAVIRPCTIDEVIKKLKRDDEHQLLISAGVIEKWLAEQGLILFFSNHLEDVAPEGRTLVSVPRPTGNVHTDTLEKLRGLLTIVEQDFRSQLGLVAWISNIGSVDALLPWQKEVLKQATWLEGTTMVEDWPFEIVDGELGPVYGKQMVAWQPALNAEELIQDMHYATNDEGHGYVVHIDEIQRVIREAVPAPINQIQVIVDLLKNDPTSSRMILNLWNVGDLPHQALPPCHVLTQFYSEEMTEDERLSWAINNMTGFHEGWKAEYIHHAQEGREAVVTGFMDGYGVPTRRLSCMMTQRSQDSCLGESYNIAFYSLLTHMLAQVTDHAVHEFIHVQGDKHIYANHIEGAEELLTREPLKLPKLVLNNKVKNIFDFTADDIQLEGYEYHPAISFEVAV